MEKTKKYLKATARIAGDITAIAVVPGGGAAVVYRHRKKIFRAYSFCKKTTKAYIGKKDSRDGWGPYESSGLLDKFE